jgi:Ni/Fe-hydrogenase 1 B-type cytochrome subunit
MLCLSEVYVWEVPVRLTHWVNVICLITLSFTGYYIGHPYMDSIHPMFYGVHLKEQWVMGWMRLIHFSTAYVFAMSVLLRIYWGFSGNRYARWSAMIPFTKKRLKVLVQDIRFYLLLEPAPPVVIGHSATAGLAYIILFLGYIVSILTGFALMSQSHVGPFWKAMGGWALPYFPVQYVRLVHHSLMWFLIVFPIVHMYIGWMTDLVEENCVMSSIFSGHKTCQDRREE